MDLFFTVRIFNSTRNVALLGYDIWNTQRKGYINMEGIVVVKKRKRLQKILLQSMYKTTILTQRSSIQEKLGQR